MTPAGGRRRSVPWQLLAAAGIALAALCCFIGLGETGLPLRLEGTLLDLRFRLFPSHPPPGVVIVAIDDASITALGRWPWSRDVFARVLDRLAGARARVIGFDLLFSEAQPDGDAAFAGAIARDAPVIIPFVLDLKRHATADAQLPPPWLSKAALNRVRGTGPDNLPAVSSLRLPIPMLSRDALPAHVTLAADSAGTYRYAYPVLRYADAYYASLPLEAVRVFLGVSRINTIVEVGRGIELGRLHVPTDEAMRLGVKYYPPARFAVVGFADALSGRVPPEVFANRIVLIGATAEGLGDVVATPYTPTMPGVLWHATLIANMLGRDFLRRDSGAIAVDMLLIVCSCLGIGLAAWRGVGLGVLAAAASLLTIVMIDGAAFARYGVWLNAIFPIAAMLLTTAVVVGGGYVAARLQGRRIRAAFSRYLHADLVDALCRTPSALQLGGEERELTVLFADVRDFSTVAEGLSAAELVRLMNELFSALTDVVLAHRGMLDKYIGDGLMAVFGAPLPDTAHARHACEAALGMQDALAWLRAHWQAQGRPLLDIRVGINTGRMVIGNMGTDRRFDYTVMGDEVNVAARLEAANKQTGSSILISASTAAALGQGGTLRAHGSITVKGRQRPVEVFELLSLNDALGARTLGESVLPASGRISRAPVG